MAVPCDPLGVSWGALGVILVSFWEPLGAQNGANNLQKRDPESKHFLDDFLERFGHPSTLKSEHMAREVLQKSHFHHFQFLPVWGTIFASKRFNFGIKIAPKIDQYLCLKTVRFESHFQGGTPQKRGSAAFHLGPVLGAKAS